MTLKLHLATNANEAMKNLDHSYVAGGGIKWNSSSGNSLAVSYETNCALNHMLPGNQALGYSSQRDENLMLTQKQYRNVHNNFSHSSPKLETI